MVMMPQGIATSSALNGLNAALSQQAPPLLPDDVWGQEARRLYTFLAFSEPQAPQTLMLQQQIAVLQTQSKRHEFTTALEKKFPGNGFLLSAFKDCLKEIPFLEPDSQQTALLKLFARFFGQMQGIPKKDIDKQLLNCDRLALINVTGALFTISSTMAPESPAAINIQRRIDDIQEKDKALEAKMKALGA